MASTGRIRTLRRVLGLHLPPHLGHAPLVVLVPGGGWFTADPGGLVPLASWLADHGIAAATTTYRAAQEGARFPTQADDVDCAIDAAAAQTAHAGVRPERVVVLGHSAGAHLALLVALTGHRFRDTARTSPPVTVDAAIGLAGPYDVLAYRQLAEPLIGAPPAAAPTAWRQADALTWVHERTRLPVLLLHGADDTIVPPASTTSFAALLRDAGHPVRAEPVGGANHTTICSPAVAGPRVLEWIRSLG